jgi:hypothetical protein
MSKVTLENSEVNINIRQCIPYREGISEGVQWWASSAPHGHALHWFFLGRDSRVKPGITNSLQARPRLVWRSFANTASLISGNVYPTPPPRGSLQFIVRTQSFPHISPEFPSYFPQVSLIFPSVSLIFPLSFSHISPQSPSYFPSVSLIFPLSLPHISLKCTSYFP